jgi:hypothetical protein
MKRAGLMAHDVTDINQKEWFLLAAGRRAI